MNTIWTEPEASCTPTPRSSSSLSEIRESHLRLAYSTPHIPGTQVRALKALKILVAMLTFLLLWSLAA